MGTLPLTRRTSWQTGAADDGPAQLLTNPRTDSLRTWGMTRLIQVLRFTRPDPSDCEHRNVVTKIGAGLERSVCPLCGQIKLRYIDSGLAWNRVG